MIVIMMLVMIMNNVNKNKNHITDYYDDGGDDVDRSRQY